MFIVILFTVIFLLPITFVGVGYAVSFKTSGDRDKLSPFECGFTNKFAARLPFSIRFFVVALIFLVFDVELILLFPLVPATSSAYIFSYHLSLLLAVLILVAGLAHEVFQGSLVWAS